MSACSSTSASEWPFRPRSCGMSTPPMISCRPAPARGCRTVADADHVRLALEDPLRQTKIGGKVTLRLVASAAPGAVAAGGLDRAGLVGHLARVSFENLDAAVRSGTSAASAPATCRRATGGSQHAGRRRRASGCRPPERRAARRPDLGEFVAQGLSSISCDRQGRAASCTSTQSSPAGLAGDCRKPVGNGFGTRRSATQYSTRSLSPNRRPVDRCPPLVTGRKHDPDGIDTVAAAKRGERVKNHRFSGEHRGIAWGLPNRNERRYRRRGQWRNGVSSA
jgi:hypothetical protein